MIVYARDAASPLAFPAACDVVVVAVSDEVLGGKHEILSSLDAVLEDMLMSESLAMMIVTHCSPRLHHLLHGGSLNQEPCLHLEQPSRSIRASTASSPSLSEPPKEGTYTPPFLHWRNACAQS